MPEKLWSLQSFKTYLFPVVCYDGHHNDSLDRPSFAKSIFSNQNMCCLLHMVHLIMVNGAQDLIVSEI